MLSRVTQAQTSGLILRSSSKDAPLSSQPISGFSFNNSACRHQPQHRPVRYPIAHTLNTLLQGSEKQPRLQLQMNWLFLKKNRNALIQLLPSCNSFPCIFTSSGEALRSLRYIRTEILLTPVIKRQICVFWKQVQFLQLKGRLKIQGCMEGL